MEFCWSWPIPELENGRDGGNSQEPRLSRGGMLRGGRSGRAGRDKFSKGGIPIPARAKGSRPELQCPPWRHPQHPEGGEEEAFPSIPHYSPLFPFILSRVIPFSDTWIPHCSIQPRFCIQPSHLAAFKPPTEHNAQITPRGVLAESQSPRGRFPPALFP